MQLIRPAGSRNLEMVLSCLIFISKYITTRLSKWCFKTWWFIISIVIILCMWNLYLYLVTLKNNYLLITFKWCTNYIDLHLNEVGITVFCCLNYFWSMTDLTFILRHDLILLHPWNAEIVSVVKCGMIGDPLRIHLIVLKDLNLIVTHLLMSVVLWNLFILLLSNRGINKFCIQRWKSSS